MKRATLLSILVIIVTAGLTLGETPATAQGRGGRPNIFAPPATPTGPIVDVVNGIVTAFNNQDTAYLQARIAPDAVWFDEDGHHLLASVWMNRLLSATPARKLTITNLRIGNWDTAGWAGFNYVIEGTNQVKGTNTMFFRKRGNDWQIVLIHGAVDTPAVAH